MTDEIAIEDIRRLRIEPGDHLLVRLPTGTTLEKLVRCRDTFLQVWPSVPVIVTSDVVEITVVNGGPS